MTRNACCVPGCLVTKKDGITLHHFPNPDVFAEKFNTWVSKIGGEIARMDNFDVFRHRRVCDKHFEAIHKYPKNRLSMIAIPALYLPGQMHTESVIMPALPSTSGVHKTLSDIQMRDQLVTEPVTMSAICSTSGVQETLSDIQMRGHQQHSKQKGHNKDHNSTTPKDMGVLEKSSNETADLMFFDDLFDSLNGNFSEIRQGKNYCAAVTETSLHHNLWNYSMQIFKTMKFVNGNNQGVVPSLFSWIKTIESFKKIVNF